ncbi:hypothetical protein CLAN_1138 [Campylobacter lanienae NCTC 13004]|uniref:Uncharacterized protein n=1 Tax=Campylobacter lanienae NCTC 13004 TaxID=1031753 RepID=A0A1X9SNP6_9BACT|nr:hypothetical protein CLAN_1138 [Campylobacter lanienae NCTC 13004]
MNFRYNHIIVKINIALQIKIIYYLFFKAIGQSLWYNLKFHMKSPKNEFNSNIINTFLVNFIKINLNLTTAKQFRFIIFPYYFKEKL